MESLAVHSEVAITTGTASINRSSTNTWQDLDGVFNHILYDGLV